MLECICIFKNSDLVLCLLYTDSLDQNFQRLAKNFCKCSEKYGYGPKNFGASIIRMVVRIVGMGRMSHICNTKCSRLQSCSRKYLSLENLLRGSLRQYPNCTQEKNSQKLSRAPVEGVRCEATRVQFCSSSYLPS